MQPYSVKVWKLSSKIIDCLENGYTFPKLSIIQFLCTCLTRECCNSVFSKILLTVISRLVVNGIAQNFLHKVHIIRRTLVQFVCTYLTRGRCNFVFFQNYSDSNVSACIKWNNTKFLHNIHANRKKHWYNLCVRTFLGGVAILFFQKKIS